MVVAGKLEKRGSVVKPTIVIPKTGHYMNAAYAKTIADLV
jgi:hypothetical protein